MQTVQALPAFEDCYPPEIVEWVATFDNPDTMTEHQRRILQITDDAQVCAAAQHYFQRLDDCDTPDEANALIKRFQTSLDATATAGAAADLPALFVWTLQ